MPMSRATAVARAQIEAGWSTIVNMRPCMVKPAKNSPQRGLIVGECLAV